MPWCWGRAMSHSLYCCNCELFGILQEPVIQPCLKTSHSLTRGAVLLSEQKPEHAEVTANGSPVSWCMPLMLRAGQSHRAVSQTGAPSHRHLRVSPFSLPHGPLVSGHSRYPCQSTDYAVMLGALAPLILSLVTRARLVLD
jgi:hypothetical protein